MEIEKKSPLISVVVCTYNRVDVLRDVLQTLAEQTLDDSFFELIIVDNNSSDETAEISRFFCETQKNAKYFFESRQGLSHARNRGWHEARGEYVAYVDDDCKIPQQYLSTAKSIIESMSPVAFGGSIFAFYNSNKPRWYKDSYGSFQAFEEPCVLKDGQCRKIYGGNMVFRRSAISVAGGFDPKLGMKGDKIAYSEESALLTHMADIMPNEIFYYDPALYVYHLVPEKKMSLRWLVKSTFSLGRYSMESFGIWNMPKDADRMMVLRLLLKQLRLIFLDLFLCIFGRDRTKYEFFQNYLFENTFNKLLLLGRLYEKFLRMSNKKVTP